MESRSRVIFVDGAAVSVWLHTATDPSPAEWAEACAMIANSVSEKSGGDLSIYRMFVVTDGGAPNAPQRKELYKSALGGYPVPTAVVTTVVATNPIKRGIATALHWINPQFRVFEPHEILLALDHVRIARPGFDSIWTALLLLQATMPPIKTLSLVAAELGLATASRPASRL